tara:strand:- start:3879 stop:4145 length:267 start_codon:yes stop_codon:yes gene_type:complete
MKNSKLAKIAGAAVLSTASLFSGCSNSAGGSFDFLKVKFQNDSAAYGHNDSRDKTDQTLFEGKPEAYKPQAVPVPEGFWKSYQNRERK